MKKRSLSAVLVLANDAESGDCCYLDVGRNFKARLKQSQSTVFEPVWLMPAGTAEGFHYGRTLGALAEAHLRLSDPSAVVLANRDQHNWYGSYEEVKGGLILLKREGYEPGQVQLVFYGPWWHLARVQLIWLLFFRRKWGKARFVQTHDDAEFVLQHEAKAWVRIFLIRFGLVKGRDQAPYN